MSAAQAKITEDHKREVSVEGRVERPQWREVRSVYMKGHRWYFSIMVLHHVFDKLRLEDHQGEAVRPKIHEILGHA